MESFTFLKWQEWCCERGGAHPGERPQGPHQSRRSRLAYGGPSISSITIHHLQQTNICLKKEKEGTHSRRAQAVGDMISTTVWEKRSPSGRTYIAIGFFLSFCFSFLKTRPLGVLCIEQVRWPYPVAFIFNIHTQVPRSPLSVVGLHDRRQERGGISNDMTRRLNCTYSSVEIPLLRNSSPTHRTEERITF